MKPAPEPRRDLNRVRLMVVSDSGIEHSSMKRFADYLNAGDLVVVNDAATLPASLQGLAPSGAAIEIRLLGQLGNQVWQVVAFGRGNWLTPTENRLPPPRLKAGDVIAFATDFRATVIEPSNISERLLTIEFATSTAEFWQRLYRYGKPVQYSYMVDELRLWSVQNVYSGLPLAVEMPSAGYAIDWQLLLALRRRGVRVVPLTHGAGISSTGDEKIDRELPLEERFEIPSATISAIAEAKSRGDRVIAVGTSVVRALESAAMGLTGCTSLKIGPGFRLQLVDGLLTGTHDSSESHYQLLGAFLNQEMLVRATDEFEQQGYLTHEFGDLCLVLDHAAS